MVLKQQRGDCNDVLIIDASKGFEKIGKNNKLRSSDIKRIVDTVSARMWTSFQGLSAVKKSEKMIIT